VIEIDSRKTAAEVGKRNLGENLNGGSILGFSAAKGKRVPLKVAHPLATQPHEG
jgi:hypothetical protein